MGDRLAPPEGRGRDFDRWCWEMRHVYGYSWRFTASLAGASVETVRRCAGRHERGRDDAGRD